MQVDSQETSGRSQQTQRGEGGGRAGRVQQPQRRNARHTHEAEQEERQSTLPRLTPSQRKPLKMPPPINAIANHSRFNADTILEADITLKVRELMDVAPIVRCQIANGMRSSVP